MLRTINLILLLNPQVRAYSFPTLQVFADESTWSNISCAHVAIFFYKFIIDINCKKNFLPVYDYRLRATNYLAIYLITKYLDVTNNLMSLAIFELIIDYSKVR